MANRVRPSTRWGITAAPEFNVAVFALLLNYPWELLQVPFFLGMAGAPHWDAILFCSRAALGDAAIALVAFTLVAVPARSRRWILRPTPPRILGFVATGLLITLAFEWIATDVLDRWQYAPAMPRLPVVGTGVLPFIQWILLPPLVLWFARRQVLGAERAARLSGASSS